MVTVGEGRYRKVREFGANKVIKQMKRQLEKHYGPITVKYPMQPYHTLKFGARDMNLMEFENYKKITQGMPAKLKISFAKAIGVRKKGGNTYLVMERVRNKNREPSRTMVETGEIGNKMFWKRLDAIEQYLLNKNIPLFNIRAENILVRKISEKTWVPVLIDFKRLGAKTYPFQPHLRLKPFAEAKLKRQFQRLREKYKP